MSRYYDLEADLELLNLALAQSEFAKFRGPFLDQGLEWNMPGNFLMNNTYGNQEWNQAIQQSQYILPNTSPETNISTLPACLYEPALLPNLVEIPEPIGAGVDAESARSTPGGEMHWRMNQGYPGLVDEATTAVPIASGSDMADAQEPTKRGRGRPKGSKTKQRVSLLASNRNIPTKFETHFSKHPAKPKTPEEKAQAKLDKAAIRLANKKASRKAKEEERKANAAAKKKAKQNF